MKKCKHTPGPWKFHEQGDANQYCLLTNDKRWVIAFSQNGELHTPEQIANAKLIAAAPDLLEALEETDKDLCVLESTMRQIEQKDHLAHGMTELVIKWRSRNKLAIKKATV